MERSFEPEITGHESTIAALEAIGFGIERGPNDQVPEVLPNTTELQNDSWPAPDPAKRLG